MLEKVFFKYANIDETFELDWRDVIVTVWRPDADYVLASIIRPPVGNGHYYEATTAGRSSRLLPEFVPAVGETFTDGTVIWTGRHPSTPVLDAISESVWTPDAGISEVSNTINGFLTKITISGGVEGEQYRAINVITRSTGEREKGSMIIEIIALEDV